MQKGLQNPSTFIVEGGLAGTDIKDEKKGIQLIECWAISDESQQSPGDCVQSIALEEQGISQQKRIPWTIRMNDVIARWYGIQIGILFIDYVDEDRIRTPPPPYSDEGSDSSKEEPLPEERDLFRTICQIFVCILCVAVAILW